MPTDLEKLCSKITLSEGEKVGITIIEDEIAEVCMIGEQCLVGRIWAEKQINKDAFKSVLSRL
jgi:predicted DNA-binding antitoxin AbrB/MazE fold protein